jgi:DNA-3-methyladenine glycosylase II
VRRPSIAAATRALAARDRAIAELLARHGPIRLPPPAASPFEALVESIQYQQLAGAAAAAIHARLVALFPSGMTPEAMLALPEDALRRAGLSGAKAASVRDLAAKVLDGTVPLGRIGLVADDEVVRRLSAVRGIGPWTADMFLIFQLRRVDVWPVLDYGVQKGYAMAFGLDHVPKPRELMAVGDRFRPYRTVAAWYCWRTVAPTPPGSRRAEARSAG